MPKMTRRPGVAAIRRNGTRPATWPGKSGTFHQAKPARTTASTTMLAKAARHPKVAASAAAAGMPSDNATVTPPITIAMARPRRSAATMRAA